MPRPLSKLKQTEALVFAGLEGQRVLGGKLDLAVAALRHIAGMEFPMSPQRTPGQIAREVLARVQEPE